MECGAFQKNMEHCNCSYESCSKKGNCCACLHYHRSMGELPACYFPDDVEKTYDRSIARFCKTSQLRDFNRLRRDFRSPEVILLS